MTKPLSKSMSSGELAGLKCDYPDVYQYLIDEKLMEAPEPARWALQEDYPALFRALQLRLRDLTGETKTKLATLLHLTRKDESCESPNRSSKKT